MKDDQLQRLGLTRTHDGFRASLPLVGQGTQALVLVLFACLFAIFGLMIVYTYHLTLPVMLMAGLALMVIWAGLYGLYRSIPHEVSIVLDARFLTIGHPGDRWKIGRHELSKVSFASSRLDGGVLHIETMTDTLRFPKLDVDNPLWNGPRTRDYVTLAILLNEATGGEDIGDEANIPQEMGKLVQQSFETSKER